MRFCDGWAIGWGWVCPLILLVAGSIRAKAELCVMMNYDIHGATCVKHPCNDKLSTMCYSDWIFGKECRAGDQTSEWSQATDGCLTGQHAVPVNTQIFDNCTRVLTQQKGQFWVLGCPTFPDTTTTTTTPATTTTETPSTSVTSQITTTTPGVTSTPSTITSHMTTTTPDVTSTSSESPSTTTTASIPPSTDVTSTHTPTDNPTTSTTMTSDGLVKTSTSTTSTPTVTHTTTTKVSIPDSTKEQISNPSTLTKGTPSMTSTSTQTVSTMPSTPSPETTTQSTSSVSTASQTTNHFVATTSTFQSTSPSPSKSTGSSSSSTSGIATSSRAPSSTSGIATSTRAPSFTSGVATSSRAPTSTSGIATSSRAPSTRASATPPSSGSSMTSTAATSTAVIDPADSGRNSGEHSGDDWWSQDQHIVIVVGAALGVILLLAITFIAFCMRRLNSLKRAIRELKPDANQSRDSKTSLDVGRGSAYTDSGNFHDMIDVEDTAFTGPATRMTFAPAASPLHNGLTATGRPPLQPHDHARTRDSPPQNYYAPYPGSPPRDRGRFSDTNRHAEENRRDIYPVHSHMNDRGQGQGHIHDNDHRDRNSFDLNNRVENRERQTTNITMLPRYDVNDEDYAAVIRKPNPHSWNHRGVSHGRMYSPTPDRRTERFDASGRLF